MKIAVKVFTIVIIISVVCYAEKKSWTSDPVFKLDLAPDSVDDQFTGCENKMCRLITQKILPNELNSNKKFKNVWSKFKNIKNYFKRAIKVYTSNDIYLEFNVAVRSGRKSYISNFNYKAFHFFLTRALQVYRVNKCTNVFRRTKVLFDKNVLNKEVRLGGFASTSLKSNKIQFGNRSCFKIKTCYGANIASMSVFPKEEEVLIPPFEKFKITSINTGKNEMNCTVLYTLQSTGKLSYMNCKLLKKTKQNVNYGK
ncbi:GPI-linked NAD(P)(+)--arginine ADP-ribosyltransferase 1-like [Clarias gariepinus]|uniref:GPI-linked NAD(P)(+)--arginine ADP-ribosyltransferase 1-like n=1 Tax=Clarias gariepinus TaxID=13013 RepID=UPI00234C4799|nr:GPI-linked NAD(P)(+)--arginine ADP-ribosyltransferase 1-like [Clarias gariepinus]